LVQVALEREVAERFPRRLVRLHLHCAALHRALVADGAARHQGRPGQSLEALRAKPKAQGNRVRSCLFHHFGVGPQALGSDLVPVLFGREAPALLYTEISAPCPQVLQTRHQGGQPITGQEKGTPELPSQPTYARKSVQTESCRGGKRQHPPARKSGATPNHATWVPLCTHDPQLHCHGTKKTSHFRHHN
jgi:hypothetical protein